MTTPLTISDIRAQFTIIEQRLDQTQDDKEIRQALRKIYKHMMELYQNQHSTSRYPGRDWRCPFCSSSARSCDGDACGGPN